MGEPAAAATGLAYVGVASALVWKRRHEDVTPSQAVKTLAWRRMAGAVGKRWIPMPRTWEPLPGSGVGLWECEASYDGGEARAMIAKLAVEQLPEDDREVLEAWLGRGYAELGRRRGVSRQAMAKQAEKLLSRLARSPALRAAWIALEDAEAVERLGAR